MKPNAELNRQIAVLVDLHSVAEVLVAVAHYCDAAVADCQRDGLTGAGWDDLAATLLDADTRPEALDGERLR